MKKQKQTKKQKKQIPNLCISNMNETKLIKLSYLLLVFQAENHDTKYLLGYTIFKPMNGHNEALFFQNQDTFFDFQNKVA